MLRTLTGPSARGAGSSASPAAATPLPAGAIPTPIAGTFPRYGYRRITAQRARGGIVANHKRVPRIMRDARTSSCR